MELSETLQAGWYVQLEGEAFDLEDWEYTLNPPFDPVVQKYGEAEFLLSSTEFAQAKDANEVREKALALVARLNGAMAIMHSAKPVQLGRVVQVDAKGARHSTLYAEFADFTLRSKVRATAVVLGPDGHPKPPPPPQPSAAQTWNEMASLDDDIADLLEQHGRAAGWYEIYKTIEVAEDIIGGNARTKRLAGMLGASGSDFLAMRQTANYYRHARAPRPKNPISLHEAAPLLNYLVRTVLEWRQRDGDGKSAEKEPR